MKESAKQCTMYIHSAILDKFKGIVSRDFECVPDVPLEVYSFLNLHIHIVF